VLGSWDGPYCILAEEFAAEMCSVHAGILKVILPFLRMRFSTTLFCNPGAFEDTTFESLTTLVSEHTLKAVKEMGFEHMTEIQHKSIRPLLEGR
jgi:hypothetical protein